MNQFLVIFEVKVSVIQFCSRYIVGMCGDGANDCEVSAGHFMISFFIADLFFYKFFSHAYKMHVK